MAFRLDCRFFSGYRPCRYQSACKNCRHFEPMGLKILIVKLGAIGDALRTTPVLEGLRKKHGRCTITWVTDDASYPLLQGNTGIDRLMKLNFATYISLLNEHFDLLLSFDKEKEALGFAASMKADRYLGFCLSPEGKLDIRNDESTYAYELGLFDELKFRSNTRSYMEIIFPMADLAFEGEEYTLHLTDEEKRFGDDLIQSMGLDRNRDILIGLNTGCGDIFATKRWTFDGFVRLADLLHEEWGAEILLLGGPSETERNEALEKAIPFKVYNTGTHNTLKQFSSIISNCHCIVSSDTTALHIAIALKVPVVALFGSTCHAEIHLYGRGEKVISDFPCSPCYRRNCDKERTCMDAMTAELVRDKTAYLLRQSGLVPRRKRPVEAQS